MSDSTAAAKAQAQAAADRQIAQISQRINDEQSRRESIERDIIQLEQELDELYRGLNQLEVLTAKHEDACAGSMQLLNACSPRNNALRAYAERMTSKYSGSEKARISDQLEDAKSKVKTEINKTQDEIEAKKSSLTAIDSNISALRSNVVKVQQSVR